MEFMQSEDWIRKAAAFEAEMDCDISAGLELGPHFDEYYALVKTGQAFISHEKVMAFLEEALGASLPSKDLQDIACMLQTLTLRKLAEHGKLPETA